MLLVVQAQGIINQSHHELWDATFNILHKSIPGLEADLFQTAANDNHLPVMKSISSEDEPAVIVNHPSTFQVEPTTT